MNRKQRRAEAAQLRRMGANHLVMSVKEDLTDEQIAALKAEALRHGITKLTIVTDLAAKDSQTV